MSELSKRITQDVEAQGRIQSAAAQCAQRLAARYEGAAGNRAIRELAPSLILAWLEGYAAHQSEELGRAKEELGAAQRESSTLKPRSR